MGRTLVNHWMLAICLVAAGLLTGIRFARANDGLPKKPASTKQVAKQVAAQPAAAANVGAVLGETPPEAAAALDMVADDDEEVPADADLVDDNMSFFDRTLGGKQLWADYVVRGDWRIQRNAVDGHYRVLDPDNRRQAWGSYDKCRDTFTEICTAQDIPPVRGKVVLVLHGLFRTRQSMNKLKEFLAREGKYTALTVGYPTTQGTIADHARGLAHVIDHLPEAEEINFVAHSLGNLVIRHYLSDKTDRETGELQEKRIGRFVMLGPPNHGAEMAVKLVPLDFTKRITGPAARELGHGWKEVSERLVTPQCEFAIIAGGVGDERGRNPLITGDDDWVVTVASTRLAGARDFRMLPLWHYNMMNEPKVQAITLRFLQQGYFESERARQPIGAKAAEPAAR